MVEKEKIEQDEAKGVYREEETARLSQALVRLSIQARQGERLADLVRVLLKEDYSATDADALSDWWRKNREAIADILDEEKAAQREARWERELRGMIEVEKKIKAGNIDDLPVGYVPDFSPRTDFRGRPLLCPYEHCIELMPVSDHPTGKSCPAWGHNCPGGTNQVEACKSDMTWEESAEQVDAARCL